MDKESSAMKEDRRLSEEKEAQEKRVEDEWYLLQNSMYLGAYGVGRGHLGISGSGAPRIIALIALAGLLLYLVLT